MTEVVTPSADDLSGQDNRECGCHKVEIAPGFFQRVECEFHKKTREAKSALKAYRRLQSQIHSEPVQVQRFTYDKEGVEHELEGINIFQGSSDIRSPAQTFKPLSPEAKKAIFGCEVDGCTNKLEGSRLRKSDWFGDAKYLCPEHKAELRNIRSKRAHQATRRNSRTTFGRVL